MASRDPVGIRSGSSRAPIFEFLAPRLDLSGSSQITQKRAKTLQKCYFLCVWLPPDIGARLDPDWPKAVPKNAKIGARLGPDGIPTRSRLIHRSARTHSRTYFSLPRPTLAPIFLFRAPAVHQYPPLLHQNGKSSLKPNGGSTISIYLSIYLSLSLSLSSSYLSIYLICLPDYVSIYLAIYLSTYLTYYLSIYLSISLSLCLCVCLSTSLSASLKT